MSGTTTDISSSQLGELTNQGRESTYALGNRLRHLYVDQLKFMPKLIADADMIYLRATPMPRALESVQQTFWGMYPLTARTASFPPPTIITRTPADETLYPNEGNCRRFAQMARAFAQRAADRWNDTDEMHYMTKKLTKWMPENSKAVAVDSHPRLSGIMDTINSTLAHGPETRLPKEFYDEKIRASIDKIAVEEWFAGYQENREYRTLGIGALVGDIVERMTARVEGSSMSIDEIGGENGQLGTGRGGEKSIRFALSGCHDTTLAAILSAVGAFNGEQWPPYTSHIAVELFKKKDTEDSSSSSTSTASLSGQSTPLSTSTTSGSSTPSQKPGWLASMLGLSSTPSPSPSTSSSSSRSQSQSPPPQGTTIGRQPYHTLTPPQKQSLENHYVRIRYNDKPMTIPACQKPGNHLEGDESLCTLETFKRVVDGFTPRNWKVECGERIGEGVFGLDLGVGEEGGQGSGRVEEGF